MVILSIVTTMKADHSGFVTSPGQRCKFHEIKLAKYQNPPAVKIKFSIPKIRVTQVFIQASLKEYRSKGVRLGQLALIVTLDPVQIALICHRCSYIANAVFAASRGVNLYRNTTT